MLEPLYTAAEARRAEEGHDVGQLMERAGAAVAREVAERFPDAVLSSIANVPDWIDRSL